MFLSSFLHFPIKNRITQEESIAWIASVHAEAKAKQEAFSADCKQRFYQQLLQHLMKSATLHTISYRHFAIDDVLAEEKQKNTFYQLPFVSTLSDKMKFYKGYVVDCLTQLYPDLPSAENMIHVSCTGYVAPSPLQILAGGHKKVITHCYHMGCYGAMPALRMASGFDGSSEIVHTELCSLHMQPFVHTPEQLVVETLFADGVISYHCSKKPQDKPSLEVLCVHEKILPATAESMSWVINDHSFAMTLAKEVPVAIAKGLKIYLQELAEKGGISLENLFQNAFYALHPGGPKIINTIQTLFDISDHSLIHSKTIFQQHGNMSSATIPFIWDRLANDISIPSSSLIVSLAFGPGLTISGALLRKC